MNHDDTSCATKKISVNDSNRWVGEKLHHESKFLWEYRKTS